MDLWQQRQQGGRHGDVEGEQAEGQRLAMAIEAEAGIDAAIQRAVEHEVEGPEFRQVEALHTAGIAAGEQGGDAVGGCLRGDSLEKRGLVADQRYVQPVALGRRRY